MEDEVEQSADFENYGSALLSVRTTSALLEHRTDQDPEMVTAHANNMHGILGPQRTQLFP